MRWLLLSGTHLRKGAVSRSCVLLQVRYMYIHKLYICNSVLCWTKRSSTTALSLGQDPGAVHFAELEMMRYLFNMLKEKKLKMLPVVKKERNESNGSWLNLDILLLHNPDVGGMIECSNCSMWYHVPSCSFRTQTVLKDTHSLWLCDKSRSMVVLLS